MKTGKTFKSYKTFKTIKNFQIIITFKDVTFVKLYQPKKNNELKLNYSISIKLTSANAYEIC